MALLIRTEGVHKRDPGVMAGIVAAQERRSAHGWALVGPDLQVPGPDKVFAVEDAAALAAWIGQAVPGLATSAKQGGAYVARAIRTLLPGSRTPRALAPP